MSQDPRNELALLMIEKVRKILETLTLGGDNPSKLTRIESNSMLYTHTDVVSFDLPDGGCLTLIASKAKKS